MPIDVAKLPTPWILSDLKRRCVDGDDVRKRVYRLIVRAMEEYGLQQYERDLWWVCADDNTIRKYDADDVL